ncbi:MAG: hypothetical protein ACRC5M_06840 [Anaeroplasmataceae bacterium]
MRETVLKLLNNNRKFSVQVDKYTFLDMYVGDASDPGLFRFVAKYNNTSLVRFNPTFGNGENSGVQEVVIPYNQILSINVLDVAPDLLDDFKKKYPEAYVKWENANKVEYVIYPSKVPGKQGDVK